MLSKRLSKYFKSLQLKKYRLQERKFLVEGAKGVLEVLQSDFAVDYLLGTSDFLKELETGLKSSVNELIECKPVDLESVGTFKSNNAAIPLYKCPKSIQLIYLKVS